jgi:hypothetical protein
MAEQPHEPTLVENAAEHAQIAPHLAVCTFYSAAVPLVSF